MCKEIEVEELVDMGVETVKGMENLSERIGLDVALIEGCQEDFNGLENAFVYFSEMDCENKLAGVLDTVNPCLIVMNGDKGREEEGDRLVKEGHQVVRFYQ